MSYSFWRPQPWHPRALAPSDPPSYATATDTQLSGVKMDTSSAGCTPQEVRLLGLTFRLPRGGGIHHLRFFAYHTCCIWNKILTF